MLTDEQKRFLRAHKIPLSKVFDATGMTKPAYQKAMDGTEMSFASGVTPCSNSGHTLRTKAGHCIQCDVKKIAFQMRSRAKAHVYIAGTSRGKIIKVGSSINVDDRITKINTYSYGGHQDWKVLASAYVDKSGSVENYIHNKLQPFQVRGSYEREGRTQACYELFKCNFDDAYKPLSSLAGKSLSLRSLSLEQARKHYNFR